jgi:hypothetical protein
MTEQSRAEQSRAEQSKGRYLFPFILAVISRQRFFANTWPFSLFRFILKLFLLLSYLSSFFLTVSLYIFHFFLSFSFHSYILSFPSFRTPITVLLLLCGKNSPRIVQFLLEPHIRHCKIKLEFYAEFVKSDNHVW